MYEFHIYCNILTFNELYRLKNIICYTTSLKYSLNDTGIKTRNKFISLKLFCLHTAAAADENDDDDDDE